MSNSFIQNINSIANNIDKYEETIKELEKRFQDLNSLYELLIETINTLQESYEEAYYEIIKEIETFRIKQATEEELGIVKFANSDKLENACSTGSLNELTEEEANSVVRINDIYDKIFDLRMTFLHLATEEEIGTVFLATPEEVEEGKNEYKVITPKTLKENYKPEITLDVTDYHETGATEDGLFYHITKLSDTDKQIHIHGKVKIEDIENPKKTIRFPCRLIADTLSIEGNCLYKESSITNFQILNYNNQFIEIILLNENKEFTTGTVFISIYGMIDNNEEPNVPDEVEGESEGSNVNISWNE